MKQTDKELMKFLGNKYRPDLGNYWTDIKMRREIALCKTSRDWFVGEAAMYLYTHIVDSEWRDPYYQFVREVMPPCDVLDYHGSVGGWGLRLATVGFNPSFAVTISKSTKFLKWRIQQRGLKCPVYNLDKDDIPVHPLVVCFDRLQQYGPKTQQGFIQVLASLGETVIIDLNSKEFSQDGFYYPVDVSGLLGFIHDNYQVIAEKVSNHYAHLIAFRTGVSAKQTEVANDNSNGSG